MNANAELPARCRPGRDAAPGCDRQPDAPAVAAARSRLWMLVLLTCGLVVSASIAIAQLNRSARGRNIVYPEYNEKTVLSGVRSNQLKGQLFLGEGEYLPSGLVLGKAMRLEHYTPEGRTNLVARAPECLYDPATRGAVSTGRLEIVGMDGRFFLAGRHGFQVTQTNATLMISNRVRTVLHQNLLRQ